VPGASAGLQLSRRAPVLFDPEIIGRRANDTPRRRMSPRFSPACPSICASAKKTLRRSPRVAGLDRGIGSGKGKCDPSSATKTARSKKRWNRSKSLRQDPRTAVESRPERAAAQTKLSKEVNAAWAKLRREGSRGSSTLGRAHKTGGCRRSERESTRGGSMWTKAIRCGDKSMGAPGGHQRKIDGKYLRSRNRHMKRRENSL